MSHYIKGGSKMILPETGDQGFLLAFKYLPKTWVFLGMLTSPYLLANPKNLPTKTRSSTSVLSGIKRQTIVLVTFG